MRERGDAVEKVRTAADLREIVSEYLPLKKSGARYRALCPFHQEKSPSFYVDADKQLFYCFGCGVGGDVFKFLMLYEKLEFPEVLRRLAGRFGIEIPAGRTAQDGERQKVLAANRLALGYFREQLARPAGDRARRYLEGRGITAETIERFAIGYAPDGWTGLKSHLARGLKASEAGESQGVLAGLLARKEESGRTYDRFRDRVMFPILNVADEPIGFGGRVLGGGEPKYLNSPETPAFSKGDNLYGLPFAREAIRREGFAILVEGYMDVIALHQAGVPLAVGTLGTGFTAGHVRLLKRYTDRVVVNFDPDAAGRAAARRSLDVLLEHGFEVQVVTLPQGRDPDLFVREQGAEAYRRRIGDATPYIEFLARDAAARIGVETPRGKIAALNEVLPFLARIDHPVRRAGHIEMLSTVLGIEDRIVLQELRDAVR
ncbi:MAG TPA: DNA primase, partial [Candidatus Polarisedimenticolia bacterium]|nr:DNA primase [Candidatus Polarisedimenticolia bacterium]